jgi:hypothetical protein
VRVVGQSGQSVLEQILLHFIQKQCGDRLHASSVLPQRMAVFKQKQERMNQIRLSLLSYRLVLFVQMAQWVTASQKRMAYASSLDIGYLLPVSKRDLAYQFQLPLSLTSRPPFRTASLCSPHFVTPRLMRVIHWTFVNPDRLTLNKGHAMEATFFFVVVEVEPA